MGPGLVATHPQTHDVGLKGGTLASSLPLPFLPTKQYRYSFPTL